MYVCVCVRAMSPPHVCLVAYGDQKRVFDLLELSHVSAGNLIQIH